MANGADFDGSEVVLIDLDPDRLDLIKRLAERMVKARGLDLQIEATTDRRAGLTDCDAILSSYRPGGFAARVLDEKIPLKHGIIGQETQGPGGFFMALRAIHAMQDILADVDDVCPGARIFNYTNPVNVLAQAVTSHSDVPFVSLCEGPIYFADQIARAADLERDELDTVMVGLNHACWSVKHEYRGADAMPLVAEAWERRKDDPELTGSLRRQLRIAAEMDAIPADYFQYYYCQDEVLAELQAKPTTRAEDILGWSSGGTGALPRAGRERRPAARPHVLARRHPRARARDRRHGRGLQRQGRDAPGQRAERGRDAARVPRDARRRAARPLRRPGRVDRACCPSGAASAARARARATSSASTRRWRPRRLVGHAADAIRALAAHPL